MQSYLWYVVGMSDVRLYGKENIPVQASLFLPNRVDGRVVKELEKALGGEEKVVYLVEEELEPSPTILDGIKPERVVHFRFRTSRSRDLREKLMVHFQAGKHFVYLPGRPSQILGCLTDVPKPFLMQLSALHISPVPVFSGYYRKDIIQAYTTDTKYDWAVVHILKKLAPGPQSGERILEAWMKASSVEYERHPLLDKSLARMLVEGLKHNPGSLLIDGLDDSELTYTKLLGVVLALAKELKHLVKEPRLGIILPPGKGGMIANYACFLAGISPVNINYTSSETAFHSIVRQSGIRHFITARAFMNKLPQFPWPEEEKLLHLDNILRGIGTAKIAGWVAFAKMAPVAVIAKAFSLDERHGEDELALLFTSGSSGEPKGVAFTHRTVIANILQLLSKVWLPSGATFLCSLPIFHSFGLTVSTLLPPLYGFTMVTYPSPLEAKTLNDLIEKYRCSLVLTTPTFGRAMLRKAKPDTYRSVLYFIVGGEKMQPILAEEFKKKCNVQVLEGYGLTETGPVCGVNLPDAPPSETTPYYVPGICEGSIGQILPGLAVKITDPDDRTRALPLSEQGMIWLKGANVFHGYTGDKSNNEGIFDEEGWFMTGDLGHVDLNGFLTLGGRRSRFSKVGGEMVPHEVVESAVEAFVQRPEGMSHEQRAVAIVGVPDAQKGEALVLLSCVHFGNLTLSLDEIRTHLISQGIPRLWCPREIIPVESIPVLPTGKLDLRGCNMLAQEALSK